MLACMSLRAAGEPQPEAAAPVPPLHSGSAPAAGLSNAYCGIGCLYFAIKASGRDLSFTDLAIRRYVSSPEGSSMADLALLASDYGFHSRALKGLTTRFLRSCSYPVVLHVRQPDGGDLFDHYELFLGVTGDSALLFDPARSTHKEPLHLLLARWDGTGLVLSRSPIENSVFSRVDPALLAWLGVAGLLLCIPVGLSRLVKKNATGSVLRARLVSSQVELSALLLTASLIGFSYAILADGGLVSHPESVEAVEAAHLGVILPEVTVEQMASAVEKRDSVLLIDARKTIDFDKGHLPGAINLPVDAAEADIARSLGAVPQDREIILYCQSSQCPYAQKVARQIRRLGYTNLALFKGGWLEWKSWNELHPSPATGG